MKWLDGMKEAGAAFKEWGRVLTIIGTVMAGALVVIAAELLVICIKITTIPCLNFAEAV